LDHKSFSKGVSTFRGRTLPEEGYLVGYGAILQFYELAAPIPDRLALISKKHKQYEDKNWMVFTARYMPDDSISGHLIFALKYEGIDLIILKKLFEEISDVDIISLISNEPIGQYSRKIWFLYEWLMGSVLPLSDLTTGNYVDLVDENLQFGSSPELSKRHRIRNNLPGVRDFCPLVRKTPLLKSFIQLDLSAKIKTIIGKIHPDVMARTAAFLLLKDSKASYANIQIKPDM
jgi:hypothetical protein